MWWLAAICDCCFTSGVVWLIHHIEEFFEKDDGQNTIIEEVRDKDMINAEDITLHN